MSEQNLPTCLVALRAEIGNTLVETERRIEHRVTQVEHAFSSLAWELDTARAELTKLDAALGSSKENNAALVDRIGQAEQAYTQLERRSNAKIEELQAALAASITPAQACDQINKVHDEYVAKLSAERSELELTQRLLQQARDERDEARLECQDKLRALRGVRTLNRAQGERIAELQAVAPALDILSDMVKELQGKLEESEARRMASEDDFGKLVGEHEDHVTSRATRTSTACR